MNDVARLHEKFGFHESIEKMDPETLYAMLEFRYRFMEEEMKELEEAIATNDAEQIIDAFIDLCVIATTTLDLFKVDFGKAWTEVHKANMKKIRGVKDSRPNPIGLPDLVKPKKWKGPDHTDNHGLLNKIKDV